MAKKDTNTNLTSLERYCAAFRESVDPVKLRDLAYEADLSPVAPEFFTELLRAHTEVERDLEAAEQAAVDADGLEHELAALRRFNPPTCEEAAKLGRQLPDLELRAYKARNAANQAERYRGELCALKACCPALFRARDGEFLAVVGFLVRIQPWILAHGFTMNDVTTLWRRQPAAVAPKRGRLVAVQPSGGRVTK